MLGKGGGTRQREASDPGIRCVRSKVGMCAGLQLALRNRGFGLASRKQDASGMMRASLGDERAAAGCAAPTGPGDTGKLRAS